MKKHQHGEVRQSTIKDGVEQLMAFHEKHGHANVTKQENSRLAAFCWGVKFSQRNPKLKLVDVTSEETRQLSSIGFDLGALDSAERSDSEGVGVPDTSVLPNDRPEDWVGAYSPDSRRKRISRFLERRKQLVWEKKVTYDDARKEVADRRLRVAGRFEKREASWLAKVV